MTLWKLRDVLFVQHLQWKVLSYRLKHLINQNWYIHTRFCFQETQTEDENYKIQYLVWYGFDAGQISVS